MKPSKAKAATGDAKPSSPVRMTSALTNLDRLDQAKLSKKSPASKEQKISLPKPTPTNGKPAPQAVTCIEAKIDVGFGNSIFIRGCGPGLSWEKGVPLVCRDHSTWLWTAPPKTDPVEFKLLLNDEVWARGENLTVTPGEQLQVVPSF